ncbi:MAG: hypothetical protein LDL33_14580 [Desulfomonile sp.]|nr:hypothetical protein [Desulfomonile sp.]
MCSWVRDTAVIMRVQAMIIGMFIGVLVRVKVFMTIARSETAKHHSLRIMKEIASPTFQGGATARFTQSAAPQD